MGELVRVNQAAGELVVGVRRKPIIHEELGLGIKRFSIAFYQAIDFRASGLRTGDCTGSRKSRKILSKAMAGDKRVKVIAHQAEASAVIPSAHVFTRGR